MVCGFQKLDHKNSSMFIQYALWCVHMPLDILTTLPFEGRKMWATSHDYMIGKVTLNEMRFPWKE